MAASRLIASGVRCGAYRTNFIRSVVQLAGVDSCTAAQPRARATARTFTTVPSRLSDNHLPKESGLGDAEPASKAPSSYADSQDAPVPWYLQVDAPQRPLDASAHPLSDRQRIPALPEHPPPILEHFLQHVSLDLGIDDLSLLDLRHLDPPPALGANLLMLFGTARSEKHLHVSADKLCRWLRSEHKLSPHADGLLGRNELKLKLRRKARKARMLSNAGVSENSLAADDGIQTGWICVNVGSVKAAESSPTTESEIQNFVGFGGKLEGVNIVLQLFTEEKRAELDLENLWNGVLKTDRRRKEDRTSEIPIPPTKDRMYNTNGAVLDDSSIAKNSNPFHPNPLAPLQTRAFHTTRARQDGTRMAHERAGKHRLANNRLSLWKASLCTAADANTLRMNRNTPFQLSQRAKSEQHDQAIELANMLELLHQMPKEEKLEVLGTGYPRDPSNLTSFLRGFNSYIPEFPDVVHYEAIMQLYIIAGSVNHPEYPVFLISDLIREMQVAGVHIPERMFLASLRAILSCEHAQEFDEDDVRRRNQTAFSLLYAMQGYSYPVLTDDVILMLHDSVSTPVSDQKAQHTDPAAAERRDQYNHSVRHELLHKIDTLDIPLKRETFAHLLRSYALLGDLEGMWHVWSAAALSMHSRSAYMYAIVLNAVAFSGSEVACSEAVRDCAVTMGQEIPAVELKDDVRDALMRCILVIDPGIDVRWEKGNMRGEFMKLWSQCIRGLRDEDAGKKESSMRCLPDLSVFGQVKTA